MSYPFFLLWQVTQNTAEDQIAETPQQICKSCLTELEKCYSFQTICNQNELKLQQILKSSVKIDSSHEGFDTTPVDKNNTLQIKINKSTITCIECSKEVKNLSEHQKYYHTTELAHKCGKCPKTFPYKSTLEQHIKYFHNRERKFVQKLCPYCGKKLFSNKALKYHILTHTGEEPFKCRICDKGFKSNSHKKEHEMGHTGEKPHGCKHCGKCFKTKNILKCHVRIHTGECPFVCKVCKRAFNQSSSLRTHMKRHKSSS